MMCWWGIWILCLSPTTNGSLGSSSRSAQYGAIVSPIFTVMCVSFSSFTYRGLRFFQYLDVWVRLTNFGEATSKEVLSQELRTYSSHRRHWHMGTIQGLPPQDLYLDPHSSNVVQEHTSYPEKDCIIGFPHVPVRRAEGWTSCNRGGEKDSRAGTTTALKGSFTVY